MRASQPKNVSVKDDDHVKGETQELRTGRQIDQINRELRTDGADHPYVLLLTVPGIGVGAGVHDRLKRSATSPASGARVQAVPLLGTLQRLGVGPHGCARSLGIGRR